MAGQSTELTRRITMPPGGKVYFAAMADGTRVRIGRWEPETKSYRGAVMLLQGRAEFLEKYFETIHDLLDRGFSVVSFDWRGQGLSDRLDHGRDIDHVEDFGLRVDDLEFIRQRHFETKLKPPFYAVGHSMGGHLLLRHMLRHPRLFEKYVALAPMLGISPGPLPHWFVRTLTKVAIFLGLKQRYMLTQKGMRTIAERELAGIRLTHDAQRRKETYLALQANPALHLGGVSFGWMNAVFRSCALMLAAAQENQKVFPALILLAEEEFLVDNDRTLEFARTVPIDDWEIIENGRHELLKETDEIRQQVLGKIMRFLRAP
ncbi:MAG: alpha/beta hydrolase [Pseudomonadota bacterium]